MVSKRFKKQAETLRYLHRLSPHAAKTVIKSGDNQLVNALCEGSLNVLRGNVRLTPHHKRRLRRYKKDLRALANRRISAKHKKVLLQRGGFLSALLPPIIGILGSLFSR